MKILPLIFGFVGLIIICIIYSFIMKNSSGTEKIKKIGKSIHEGSMVFMIYEYKVLSLVSIVIFCLLYYFLGINTALSFILGCICSASAGFIGMFTATKSNMKTTFAAYKYGISEALTIAFLSGSITGLAVASLGIIGISFLYNLFEMERSRSPKNDHSFSPIFISFISTSSSKLYLEIK